MASIIKANINLNEIPKDKIYKGKKGSYLPITITINDEVDQFGNQGPVVVEQSKEERVMRSAGYLSMGVALTDWGSEDMTSINAAITAAESA